MLEIRSERFSLKKEGVQNQEETGVTVSWMFIVFLKDASSLLFINIIFNYFSDKAYEKV